MAAFAKNLLNWTSGRFTGSPVTPSTPMTLPTMPQPNVAAMTAIAARRARRLGVSSPANNGTLLTGPSGLAGEAPTQRPTLLGG